MTNTHGLWNTIQVLDINNDGKLDFIVGNMGLNTRMKASIEKPLQLYVNDFDQNGSVEQILTQYEGDSSFPLVLKGPLLKQLPYLRKQLLNYDAYKNKTLETLFSQDVLDNSLVLKTQILESQLYINDGKGTYRHSELPSLVQSSPVFTVFAEKDTLKNWEIILGGNLSKIKPELGINMGSYGWYLKSDGGHIPQLVSSEKSGLFVDGEIRDIKKLRGVDGFKYLVVRNNCDIVVFEKGS
ncbi:hypothetical protein MM213_04495 [Belliella sp. R4-6]|uniref:Repeat domain-containing protein n=1 Tax=Belliella alkalica TaxID=1730871 RepID=A0ABS9V9Y0_9BACT|nr:hypothetical protein [Belliella alkalica]MCH7412733.1 hypothetical protein [Belliella alkalica]